MVTCESDDVYSYLIDDNTACHTETCLWSKVVCDHDPEAGLWEPVVWRARIDHLIHHHNRARSVCFSGLYYKRSGKKQFIMQKNDTSLRDKKQL